MDIFIDIYRGFNYLTFHRRNGLIPIFTWPGEKIYGGENNACDRYGDAHR